MRSRLRAVAFVAACVLFLPYLVIFCLFSFLPDVICEREPREFKIAVKAGMLTAVTMFILILPHGLSWAFCASIVVLALLVVVTDRLADPSVQYSTDIERMTEAFDQALREDIIGKYILKIIDGI